MTSEQQSSEHRTNRIRRLIYRSAYTGMRETDQLLGPFARECLTAMDDAELDAYEALLDEGDPIIWGWLSGNVEIPVNYSNPALDRLMLWCENRQS